MGEIKSNNWREEVINDGNYNPPSFDEPYICVRLRHVANIQVQVSVFVIG